LRNEDVKMLRDGVEGWRVRDGGQRMKGRGAVRDVRSGVGGWWRCVGLPAQEQKVSRWSNFEALDGRLETGAEPRPESRRWDHPVFRISLPMAGFLRPGCVVVRICVALTRSGRLSHKTKGRS